MGGGVRNSLATLGLAATGASPRSRNVCDSGRLLSHFGFVGSANRRLLAKRGFGSDQQDATGGIHRAANVALNDAPDSKRERDRDVDRTRAFELAEAPRVAVREAVYGRPGELLRDHRVARVADHALEHLTLEGRERLSMQARGRASSAKYSATSSSLAPPLS